MFCWFTSSGPSKLIGHSAEVYKDSMLLFGGGETHSAPRNCLWKFSLTTQIWEKLPSLPGSTAPSRVYHCSVGLGPHFQLGQSNNISSKTTIISNSSDNSKFRPFKNKCFPSPSTWQPGEVIELQSMHTGNQKGLKDINEALKETKPWEDCLTFENHEAMQETKDSNHPAEETEDSMAHPMPNLMLIIGGNPLKEQAAISVWQMTLTDSWQRKWAILNTYVLLSPRENGMTLVVQQIPALLEPGDRALLN